jgi:predicted RecB family nuclease
MYDADTSGRRDLLGERSRELHGMPTLQEPRRREPSRPHDLRAGRQERRFLQLLRSGGRPIVEIASEGTLAQRVQATRAAMRDGPDVIYQGAFHVGRWHGYSDFLLKRSDTESALGYYAYDVADTKLARSAKAKHVLQLCVYAEMPGAEQGVMPPSMHVVRGTAEMATVPTTSPAAASKPSWKPLRCRRRVILAVMAAGRWTALLRDGHLRH